MNFPKLLRITTVPLSLEKLISGQMKFMGQNGFEVKMVSSYNSQFQELEQKENCKYLTVNMTRTISPFKDLLSLIQMIKVLKNERPHIVHTHTPKAGLIGMLAAKITGVPIRLHTVAGLPLMEAVGGKRKLLEMVEKLTYSCATMVYPNSGNLKSFIVKSKFCNPNKLKVIGHGSSNGIDTDSFKRDANVDKKVKILFEELSFCKDDFIYVFVGRLVRDKGIEELIRAFRKLSGEFSTVKLLLVGPEEPNLDPLSENSLREIRENPRIISVGYQNDVKPYLALSNVLVFPSYREGFPNVPMQAGCFDLPAIVTNINGCNEIIRDRQNGLIIAVKDEDALLGAMKTVLEDENLYNSMKEEARGAIIEKYEQKKMWGLILKEYNQHLKENGIV